MQTISVAAMRAAEQTAAAAGLSEETMMAHAGRNAARIIETEFRRRPGCRRVVIVTGKGNNAGDGIVAAAVLPVPAVIAAAVPLTGLTGAAACHAAGLPDRVPVVPADKMEFQPGDLIVDALLGTGFRGDVREPLATLIRRINQSGLPVIALDLPSGLDGDTGRAGLAVKADLTITFGAPKHGLIQNDGPALTGPVRIAGIGIPPENLAGDGADLFTAAEAAALLDRLPFDTHKNRRGRVLILAGSAAYPGAAVLNTRGALRTGAGYVRLACPDTMPPHLPAAVVQHPLPATPEGTFGQAAIPAITDLLATADAVAAGSGWSQHPELLTVLQTITAGMEAGVLDADGLRLLPRLGRPLRGRWVLTPHPGEAAALLDAFGESPASRPETALSLARHTGAVTVLKGPQSIVAAPDGRYSVNSSGSPALATAGSGDVLTGVTAALLAAGLSAFDAARLAVYLHGRAGETTPQRGLIADDLPDLIRAAMAEVSPVC